MEKNQATCRLMLTVMGIIRAVMAESLPTGVHSQETKLIKMAEKIMYWLGLKKIARRDTFQKRRITLDQNLFQESNRSKHKEHCNWDRRSQTFWHIISWHTTTNSLTLNLTNFLRRISTGWRQWISLQDLKVILIFILREQLQLAF